MTTNSTTDLHTLMPESWPEVVKQQFATMAGMKAGMVVSVEVLTDPATVTAWASEAAIMAVENFRGDLDVGPGAELVEQEEIARAILYEAEPATPLGALLHLTQVLRTLEYCGIDTMTVWGALGRDVRRIGTGIGTLLSLPSE